MKRIIETIIETNINPTRIDNFLAERFTYNSRSAWQKQIAQGNISINNIIIKNTHKKVKFGDKICYYGKRKDEPEVNKNFQIIYEDKYIIAINKTGDLPVHPAGIFFKNTLQTILEKNYNTKIYLIHRLDRETSGVILAARNPEIAKQFQKSLTNAKKTYNAIVHGNCPNQFTVDMPIGPAINSIIRKKRAAYQSATESAFTAFKKIRSYKNYSLIEALPKTGRLHQIRVHLEYAGYPILGDKIYGKDENFYLRFIENGMTESLLKDITFSRCALHAKQLDIYHPYLTENISFKTDLPKEFEEFLKKQEERLNGNC